MRSQSHFFSRYDGQTPGTIKGKRFSRLVFFSLFSFFFFFVLFLVLFFFCFCCALYIMDPRHGLEVCLSYYLSRLQRFTLWCEEECIFFEKGMNLWKPKGRKHTVYGVWKLFLLRMVIWIFLTHLFLKCYSPSKHHWNLKKPNTKWD